MTEFTRLRLSIDTTRKFQVMKARTGLTPNVLSRFALCYSLNDPFPLDPSEYDEEGQELNRSTLLGEWNLIYISLLKQRLSKDGLDPEKDLYDQLRAHIDRGAFSIYNRVKSLSDLCNLLPEDLTKSNDSI